VFALRNENLVAFLIIFVLLILKTDRRNYFFTVREKKKPDQEQFDPAGVIFCIYNCTDFYIYL
jgi:hypothetical protein